MLDDLIKISAPEVKRDWEKLAPPNSNLEYKVFNIPEHALAVYFHTQAEHEAQAHAASDRSIEVGGALIGGAYEDPNGSQKFILIRYIVKGDFTRGSSARLTFTADTWAEILRVAETNYSDQRIVGWYHTHPNYGIFLSELDQEIQSYFFGDLDQVALVIDPVQSVQGFFHGTNLHNRKIAQTGAFSYATEPALRVLTEDVTAMPAAPALTISHEDTERVPPLPRNDPALPTPIPYGASTGRRDIPYHRPYPARVMRDETPELLVSDTSFEGERHPSPPGLFQGQNLFFLALIVVFPLVCGGLVIAALRPFWVLQVLLFDQVFLCFAFGVFFASIVFLVFSWRLSYKP